MIIRKRVIAATFHAVVALAYLIMWIFKWSTVNSIPPVVNNDSMATWHSPAEDAIDEIMLLKFNTQECYISIYDDLYLRISHEHNTDWRLMSAIGYTESRFKPYVRSHSGAIGLMQIMPRTAAIYGIPLDKAAEPEENIRIAAQHYNLIDYMLDMPDSIDDHDRMSLNLASYHGGIGRIADAQRLARYAGENPYSWSDVSQQLINLQDSVYYELPIVKNGQYRSAQNTVKYVNIVMRRYDKYCTQTENCPHHLYPVTGHMNFM